MSTREPRPAMGIATKITHTNKRIFASYAQSFNSSKNGDIEQAIKLIFSADAKIDAFHPVNETKGQLVILGTSLAQSYNRLEAFKDVIILLLGENI